MCALLCLGVLALRRGSCIQVQVLRRGSCIVIFLPIPLLLLRLLCRLLCSDLVAGASLVLVKIRGAKSKVGR